MSTCRSKHSAIALVVASRATTCACQLRSKVNTIMTYVETWDEFSKAADRIYSQDPWKARFVVKYRHCDGSLTLKITDDKVCVKYRTDQLQDVKKLEKLNNVLMRHMVAK